MSPRTLELIRGNLIKQLLYFDEELPYFLEKTAPEPGERNEITAAANAYRRRLALLLGNPGKDDPRSVVLIGCTVTIEFEEDGQTETFTIVLPDHSNVDEGYISFVSPLGRRLLLTRIGERVEVVSPSSAYNVIVKDIQYKLPEAI